MVFTCLYLLCYVCFDLQFYGSSLRLSWSAYANAGNIFLKFYEFPHRGRGLASEIISFYFTPWSAE